MSLLAISCSSGSTSGPASPSAIAILSGSGQSAAVGHVLTTPFVVRVTTAAGDPATGVTVTWSASAGGGTILPATTTTGSDGTASATATVGTRAGAYAFQATANGLSGSPVNFAATGSPGPAAALAAVSGGGQSGAIGVPLANPLVVQVTDAYGNGVGGVTIAWAPVTGGGSIVVGSPTTAADGTASATGVLGGGGPTNVFRATTGAFAPIDFSANVSPALYYTEPAAGGKLRLVRNEASTATTLVLDLVAGAAMKGYSTGFNLPIDASKVSLATPSFVPGTALAAGAPPLAAGAVLKATGPLANVLVSALSQKAAGAGAVATDATISVGQVFYSLRLDLKPGATAGVVFDGSALPVKFSGGLRDKGGTDVASSADFRIGKLEVR
ncbi:MAG: Ig-like domain-containing protein [Deltaproteobacteria bacterium]